MAGPTRVLRRKRPPVEYSSDTGANEPERAPRKKRIRTVGHPRKANVKSNPAPKRKVTVTAFLRNTPPWPMNLEYDILLDIFQYAASSLENDLFETTPSIKWLIDVATTCKAFHEPAMGALYHTPPISRPNRARGLLARLQAQGDEPPINYRTKVRYLSTLAGTVSLTYNGHDPFQLEELVALTPGLRGLDIRLNSDDPRRKRLESTYFEQNTRISHIYQEKLIKSLEQNSIHLRAWRWNLKFNKTDPFPWNKLSSIHSGTSFERLQTLELSKLHSVEKTTKDRALASIIQSITPLKQLKEMIFTMCEIHSYEDTLRQLPLNLESISFRDCSGLTSSELSSFLSTHGGNLRNLTLHYNSSLDFAFLGNLAQACPILESIHVDLAIYGALSTARPKADFRALLPEGIIPTWPRTLQDAQFHHLRKWTMPQCEPFFQSFINSAPCLPDLRTLIIKTSLDSGNWRERIPFRDKWMDVIERVFKRHSPPPIRHGAPPSSSLPKTASGSGPKKPSPVGRKTRSRTAEMAVRTRQSTTKNEVPNRPKHPSLSDVLPFIHGMCNIVEVRVDNLRPAEFQFTEADFLDQEESGDEEWQSDETTEDGEDESYAW